MLRFSNRIRFGIVIGSAFLLSGGAGCASRTIDAMPPDEVARGALDAALKSWCEGGKPGPLQGMNPPVQVHDTPWGLGAQLASYEILREDKSAAEMKFSVRLSLTKPERVEEVQYYVLGRDPVMIFRDEDYMRNINMVNGPPVDKPERSSGRRQRR